MHLCFFIGQLTGGGSESVCINLANNLAKDGSQVTIITIRGKINSIQSRINENVKQISLECNSARFALIPLLRAISKNNFSSFLAFSFETAALLVLARHILNRKFRIVARNMSVKSELQTRNQSILRRVLFIPIANFLYGKVDFVINQSRYMEVDLIADIPALRSKSRVIYNPIRHDIADKELKYLNCNSRTLLFVGRLEAEKNVFHLIDLMFNLVEIDPSYQIMVLGEGSLKTEFLRVINSRGLSKHFLLLGFADDPTPFYSAARCTILVSEYEGLPNAALESIFCGTPVVSYLCPGGIREIIKDGENGYLVSKNDIVSMAHKIVFEIDKLPSPFEIRNTLSDLELDKAYSYYKGIIIGDELRNADP
jgi:glycosyltransferase involved in cell wall biosynthesis